MSQRGVDYVKAYTADGSPADRGRLRGLTGRRTQWRARGAGPDDG